jgi:hypothetical protein
MHQAAGDAQRAAELAEAIHSQLAPVAAPARRRARRRRPRLRRSPPGASPRTGRAKLPSATSAAVPHPHACREADSAPGPRAQARARLSLTRAANRSASGLVAVAIGARRQARRPGAGRLGLADETKGEPGERRRAWWRAARARGGEDQRPGSADAVRCRLPSPAAPPRAGHCGCENLGAEVPDRSATLVGYREREPGRLHLRAVLRGRTEGVCDAIVEEDQK